MNNDIKPELLFLIARFLEDTPCTAATRALKEELDKYQLLPKRRTWQGSTMPSTFKDTVAQHKLVCPESLSKLLQLVLNQQHGKNKSYFQSPLSLVAASQSLPAFSLKQSANSTRPQNFLRTVNDSYLFGSRSPRHSWPATRYRTCASSVKVFAHLAPIFCVAFDKNGEIVFTGSDDHLIKAWHLASGRLLATFRGHHSEISDIAISPDNSLMASGSCDKSVRVWDLRTTANLTVLKGHTGTVTVVTFSPMYHADGDSKTPPHYFCYLASGGADGVICLWRWRSFDGAFMDKPIKFFEKSRAGVRILSMSFSEGGFYLVAGSSDACVRVYTLAVTFEKVAELEGHMDPVDSLQFANHGIRFATASCDGSARIFHYERQHWRQLVINCSQTLSKEKDSVSKVQVCMIRWTCNDEFLVASVSDKSVKVFDSETGQLVRILKGHKNQVFCISCSNFDPYLIVSGGYDGLIIVWDLRTGEKLFTYQNKAGADFEECGAIHALSLSPDDSQSLAAADSYGHVLIFSFSQLRQAYSTLPEQLFFHTDYRAICHNAADMPLDQLSGKPPHELPPAWLIDSEGAPYPSEFQQLVPGREKLVGSENKPEVIVDDEGYHEVTDRSVADAAAGRPPQNLPSPWGPSQSLCRVLQQAEIVNLISKASALYDTEYNNWETESRRKPPKKSTDGLLNENHRLRSWDHRLHEDAMDHASFYDRATIPAVNRLAARALYDTDSEGEEERPYRGGPSFEAAVLVDRTRRAATRHVLHDDDDSGDESDQPQEVTRRTRGTRPIIEDENANDEPGPSSGRQLRSRRRRTSVSRDSSRGGQHDEDYDDESRSRHDMASSYYDDEASRASSDMSVSEAVKRITTTGASSSSRHQQQRQQQSRPPRVVVNGHDDSSDEESSASDDDSESSAENKSDDSDWKPSLSNGGSRPSRPRRHQENSRSTKQQSNASQSRGSSSRRESKRRVEAEEGARSSKRNGASSSKKSESPLPSRYSLRDHSRPSTSRAADVAGPSLTRGASTASTASPSCNGQNGGMNTRRQQQTSQEPNHDRPSERAKRYKKYLTNKKQGPSPTFFNENEASSSIPDSDIFDRNHCSNSGSASAAHGPSTSKANGTAAAANGDLERFQPPQWMSQTSPTVRFPFVPQIGDEVVYIWRGHSLYVEAVNKTNAYTMKRSEVTALPYNVYADFLNEEEFCRVEDVSFELVPDSGTRLIAVKLIVLRTAASEEEPVVLSFKFHDLANVVDFVILRQWYERSLQRQWIVGDKFRSLIDSQWYSGVIVGRQPAGPGCSFRVYRVLWDLEDDEDAVSPWDIEPLPKTRGGSSSEGAASSSDFVPYVPKEDEWPPFGDRETTCQRLVSCLDQVMHLAYAEPFVVPVDYTAYPLYPCIIAYPVDLSMIRERLVAGYYRRLEAVKWDAKFIAVNAALFNEVDSEIVRQAQNVVDILTEVIDDPDCVDASTKFPQRASTRKRVRVVSNSESDGADSDDDNDRGGNDNAKSNGKKSNGKKSNGYKQPPAKKAARSGASSVPQPPNWSTLCAEVLSRLWKSNASEPFQGPVDLQRYPDYAKIVKHPVDLGLIRRRLREGYYKRPAAFLNDVRLLLDNSRLYNTNDRAPIYTMTTQLIDIFDGALSEFGELLDDEEDTDSDSSSHDKFAASSSRGTKSSRRRDDDSSKRYRTRLTTGTIHYANVNEADEALDMAVAEATTSRRSSANQNGQANGRFHYRRLRTVGGVGGAVVAANGDGAGESSVRRPATRHLS